MSSISFKPTAAVFRLKRNYQNLTSADFAENLISYLNSARSCKRITVDDLRNVMHGVAGRTDVIEVDLVDKESDSTETQTDNKYMLGENM